MCLQLYKSSNSDLSASSSPTKNYLPVSNGERLRYLTPSPPASSSTSPSSADSSSSRRRSESLPPPLMRGANSEAFSNLARQTPEPLRTYSSEMSSSGKRKVHVFGMWLPHYYMRLHRGKWVCTFFLHSDISFTCKPKEICPRFKWLQK